MSYGNQASGQDAGLVRARCPICSAKIKGSYQRLKAYRECPRCKAKFQSLDFESPIPTELDHTPLHPMQPVSAGPIPPANSIGSSIPAGARVFNQHPANPATPYGSSMDSFPAGFNPELMPVKGQDLGFFLALQSIVTCLHPLGIIMILCSRAQWNLVISRGARLGLRPDQLGPATTMLKVALIINIVSWSALLLGFLLFMILL